jgi:arylsulfatase
MYEAIAPNQRGQPGYETYLNDGVITVAEILREAGYDTILSGKWHLSNQSPKQPPGQYLSEPSSKGFEKTFTLLEGAANHFDSSRLCDKCRNSTYLENGQVLNRPDNVFSSDLFTDEMIKFVRESHDEDYNRPLFMYLAFQVAHLPLQAPEDLLQEYNGTYDQGWDVLRQERFENQKEIGLWPANMQLPESFPPQREYGNNLTTTQKERDIWTTNMEKRAAMIDNMDYNIGRLIDYLKAIGEYDNTFILYASDNGGANPSAGINNVAVTPFSGFKSTMYEGGIRSATIVKEPNNIGNAEIIRAFTHILDLTPTFLDYAGVQHPAVGSPKSSFMGIFRASVPTESEYYKPTGSSLKPLLEGTANEVHTILDEPVSQELFGNSAVFYGSFKAVRHIPPAGTGEWELFNLSRDSTETTNIADELPHMLRLLTNSYHKYAKEVNIIPPEKDGIPIYLFGQLPNFYNYTS